MTEASRVNKTDAKPLRASPAWPNSIWKGGSELLEVVNITDEAPDVKTFTFEAAAPALFSYKAGQFLNLELPTPSVPLLRTYTISSSPSRPLTLAITVKAQIASVGTRWMFDNLVIGSLVKAVGPAGHFTLELAKRNRLLFISAGSGVTPMMSMLRWLADVSPTTEVAFIHCARSPADIIFRDELYHLSRTMKNLRLGFIVEQIDQSHSWSGLVGRIDRDKISAILPDFNEREVYCCGPDPFMKWVRSLLLSNGVPEDNYHEEAFSFPAKPEVLPATPSISQELVLSPAVRSHIVRFQTSEIELACDPEETLLQAARRAGVRILSVCEMGLCGTCKVMKTSGNVVMEHSGGITDEEIVDGYVLACCSKPMTQVEIEA